MTDYDCQILTPEALEDLGRDCRAWSKELIHSESFRHIAGEVADAIDKALRDEDAESMVSLQTCVDRLVEAADSEGERMFRLDAILGELDFCQDSAAWRRLLVAMIPDLSDAHILALRSLIIDAASDHAAVEV